MPTHYLSKEKLAELETELAFLKTDKIPSTAQRIDEARQMGDLSENAEYHAAREDMAWAQSRVKELESIIDNATVISSNSSKSDAVQIGSVITVSVNGKEKQYTVVGAQESDPLSGKISNESPLGLSFLGKKKGDKVSVSVPAGVQEYEILEIK